MADIAFNTDAGKTIARELLIAYLNTGTAENPVWSAIGKRVEDSDTEYDWDSETKRDILGATYGRLRKPTITQTFDPCELDAGDAAQVKLWNLAVKDQDAQALAAQDMLIVHFYAGQTAFAERYASCMIEITGLGGEGGGDIGMPITVTYGGTRTLGTASRDSATGVVTFTTDTVPSVMLNKHYIELAVDGTEQLSVTILNSTQSASWESGSNTIATVSSGLVTGKQAGNTIITVSITDGGVTYNDTCTVVVLAAP